MLRTGSAWNCSSSSWSANAYRGFGSSGHCQHDFAKVLVLLDICVRLGRFLKWIRPVDDRCEIARGKLRQYLSLECTRGSRLFFNRTSAQHRPYEAQSLGISTSSGKFVFVPPMVAMIIRRPQTASELRLRSK